MPINLDKPHLWKQDIAASVDLFNTWFMEFAPVAYRSTRIEVTKQVEEALHLTGDLGKITPAILMSHPGVLQSLRMSTAPPLARDRLIGLAHTSSNLVISMEKGNLPARMDQVVLAGELAKICEIIQRLLDKDIFPWLEDAANAQPARVPSETERYRASTIVADRLCGAVSEPIVRNAQEQRQLKLIEEFLVARGYQKKTHPSSKPLIDMEPGTFTFRLNVQVGVYARVNIPVDVVIQPRQVHPGKLPILIEAKSAGDFTNTNKRRKEEAIKIRQLREEYGEDAKLILFLCGYFDSGYLGYGAAEGLDWVWEHRIDDLLQLGI